MKNLATVLEHCNCSVRQEPPVSVNPRDPIDLRLGNQLVGLIARARVVVHILQ